MMVFHKWFIQVAPKAPVIGPRFKTDLRFWLIPYAICMYGLNVNRWSIVSCVYVEGPLCAIIFVNFHLYTKRLIWWSRARPERIVYNSEQLHHYNLYYILKYEFRHKFTTEVQIIREVKYITKNVYDIFYRLIWNIFFLIHILEFWKSRNSQFIKKRNN